MRCTATLLIGLGFLAAAASGGNQTAGDNLRLDRPLDGHGNSVYALEANMMGRGNCDEHGKPAVNYLFVNKKTGERRWLFPQPQSCIWRVLYFADRPRRTAIKPTDVRAVVYDVTPVGNLDTWEPFRICMGVNPCLPLRRIFISRADGRDLTPLTPTFQIFDYVRGPAKIKQRGDGVIVVSPPHGPDAEFSIDTFGAH